MNWSQIVTGSLAFGPLTRSEGFLFFQVVILFIILIDYVFAFWYLVY